MSILDTIFIDVYSHKNFLTGIGIAKSCKLFFDYLENLFSVQEHCRYFKKLS